MSGRVGVELLPGVIRAVRLSPLSGRRVSRTLEVPWDPGQPRAAVAVLAESLGSASSVSLAIGLGFLQVTQVNLPPAPPVARGRMLEVEPERYFAAAGEPLVTALADPSDMAFAAPRAMVVAWLAAFQEWAPVVSIEPAPVAAARALGPGVSGDFRLEAGPGEEGLLRLERGAVALVRRKPVVPPGPGGTRDGADTAATMESFLVASGAARADVNSPAATIAPPEWAARLRARARTRVVVAGAAAVTALLFAVWSAGRWRERTLMALDQRAAELTRQARPADDALRAMLTREAESVTIRAMSGGRPDPYGALAALSTSLPADAVVLSARARGDDWQIDGTARDASALVPVLDRDGRFENVRFLAASSRYREGNRSYETFSIALRYRPRP
jgi:hypothetical protein